MGRIYEGPDIYMFTGKIWELVTKLGDSVTVSGGSHHLALTTLSPAYSTEAENYLKLRGRKYSASCRAASTISLKLCSVKIF